MSANRQCPSCFAFQPDSLLCVDCTAAMQTMLAAAPALIEQLDIAASKQARISSGGKAGKGTAHLKEPINWGAAAARDALLVELALWSGDIDAIRKHPKAAEIVSGIGRAVKDGYRAIDRMQDRKYLGRCGMYDASHPEDRCQAELWAAPKAGDVQCPECKHLHNVAKRRLDLLEMAEDVICTPSEASSYIGEIGHINVGQQRIRNYIDRKRIPNRALPDGTMRLRVGDLLDLLRDDAARRQAKAS